MTIEQFFKLPKTKKNYDSYAFLMRLLWVALIIGVIPNPSVKVLLIFASLFTIIKPSTKFELFLFVLVNLTYLPMDIGATQLGFFEFKHQQLYGLPYYEFLLWGVYYLIALKYLKAQRIPKSSGIQFFSFILFLTAFNFTTDENSKTILCLLILMGSYFLNASISILKFIFSFLCMGIVIEHTGTLSNEWGYPSASNSNIPLWSYLVWAASGYYFYHFLAFTHYLIIHTRKENEPIPANTK